MRKKISYLICFFYLSLFGAQNYSNIDTADYALRKNFLVNFKKNNDVLRKDMRSKYSGNGGAYLGKFYDLFYQNIEKRVKDKDYAFQSPFQPMLESILSEIQKENPELKSYTILLAKDNSPNAMCLADGTFVINMGLFNWLDNEDQVAAVLSHEIAHKIKEHTLKKMLKLSQQEKNDRFVAKEIVGIESSKNQQAFDILKQRLYKKSKENRNSEKQADSLGYVIFKKSKYKDQEFIKAINNLLDYDSISPKELKVETYKALYNLPALKFDDKWMKKEDFSLYNYNLYKEKLEKDSLASHPELAIRIEMLKKEFPELSQDVDVEKAKPNFVNLQTIAKDEFLANIYHSESYGMGVYVCMQILQDNPEDEEKKKWLGYFFQKILEARKNYNLNRYLDRVDPKKQPESYQQFLNFMWNLKLEDIQKISEFYTKKES